MEKIISCSFKMADDPFFRTSFKVFTPSKFGKSSVGRASEKNKTTESAKHSGSSNNLKSDT